MGLNISEGMPCVISNRKKLRIIKEIIITIIK